MMITTDKPDIEELYSTASTTSDLTVEADRRGAGDIMIAAGWSPTRLGSALLRLHSEWDRSEKPLKPTQGSIQALVGTFQRALPTEAAPIPGLRPTADKPMPLSAGQAKEYATAWHLHEVELLLGKLKSLPSVREQLTLKALQWGMGRHEDKITRDFLTLEERVEAGKLKCLEDAVAAAETDLGKAIAGAALSAYQVVTGKRREHLAAAEQGRATGKASACIRYWLDQTCSACHGLRWQVSPGSPALSGRMCKACMGSGVAQVPHGADGRRLLNYMDSCLEAGRGFLSRNMAGRRSARNRVVDTEHGYVIIATADGTGC